MEYHAGSIVHFTDNEWGVYGQTSSDDKYAALYGISLLTALYFSRLFAMVKRDENARNLLLYVLQNPTELNPAIDSALKGYAEFYGTKNVNFKYNLSTTANAKKQCSYIVNYDLEGHFSPQFRPKGFGILGKNIEMASVSACLASALFFIDTNEKDKDFSKVVTSTIQILGSKILHLDKLSIRDEGNYSKETVAEVMKKYR